MPGGKIYVENNLDRFGQPILPRKPLDLYPAPNQYQIKGFAEGEEDIP